MILTSGGGAPFASRSRLKTGIPSDLGLGIEING